MPRPIDPSRSSAEQASRAAAVDRETSPLAVVGGCGHVGLPLGLAFARAGCRVDLVDTNAERVAQVSAGRMPFHEDEADALLARTVASGLLRATTDPAELAGAAAVIVTLGTVVDGRQGPDVAAFDTALEPLLAQLRPGQLLVLRGTIFPGMTGRLAQRLEQMGRGDVDLAYCPERTVQGRSLVELGQLPQLVGAVTPRAAERAGALFGRICPQVIFLEPVEAELAKLFCNAWRYINFAVSNQFYGMAQHFEADFQRIRQAVCEDYPRMAAFARPGLTGGPCLLKDTVQLGAFHPGSFTLGQAAMAVNEGLPRQLVQEIKRTHPLAGRTVGLLGMAFKPNSDDPRESLSYPLRDILQREGSRVLCTDPHVPDPDLVPLERVLEQADLIIVATPHDDYRGLTLRQPVIDMTGVVCVPQGPV